MLCLKIMLILPQEIWDEVVKYLAPSDQHSLMMVSRQAYEFTRGAIKSLKHAELLMSMQRAHDQIMEKLREEEAEREKYKRHNTLTNLINLRGTQAWRTVTVGEKPLQFPYLEFEQAYIVFRADTRAPSEVFLTGFRRLSEDLPSFSMSQDVGGIAYHLVSTSKSASDAMEFAVIRGRDPRTMPEIMDNVQTNRPPLDRVWVYICVATRGFYLHAPKDVQRNQHEVALIGIPSECILSAVEIDVQAARATGNSIINVNQGTPLDLQDVALRMTAEVVRHLMQTTVNV